MDKIFLIIILITIYISDVSVQNTQHSNVSINDISPVTESVTIAPSSSDMFTIIRVQSTKSAIGNVTSTVTPMMSTRRALVTQVPRKFCYAYDLFDDENFQVIAGQETTTTSDADTAGGLETTTKESEGTLI